MALTRQRKGSQELNRSWNFELILLPEEILDFLPWIIHLIEAYDQGAAALIPEPPYPLVPELLVLEATGVPRFRVAQTYDASHKLAQPSHPWAQGG